MRKIKIYSWKGKQDDGTEFEETSLDMFMKLLHFRNQGKMPRGIEAFRTLNRIFKQFKKAEESDELLLEEREYEMLRDVVENDIPGYWGMNETMNKAVNEFLDAEEV